MERGYKSSRKIRKIRDVIHDYIDITSIEDNLINSREFQRLRYISQNSLAYFTFPSNTTNRFSHSLGVMHIGGKMFCNALENTDEETLKEFLKESKNIIKRICQTKEIDFETITSKWVDFYGNISGFNHSPIDLSDPIWLDPEQITSLNILWQSVRIACMIHDIGHFPFSHLFENALNDFIQKGNPLETLSINETITQWQVEYKQYVKELNNLVQPNIGSNESNEIELPGLHEVKGVLILKNFFPNNHNNDISDLISICLTLGKSIFIHNRTTNNKSRNSILDSLHTIVSSDLDADRLDYCMRDPFASGLELGAYDLKRIISATILRKKEDVNGKYFEIVFGLSGISAIETFFHQRYLMYEYLIFHHNVSRLDGALEKVIGMLFEMYNSNHSVIKQTIEEFGMITFENDKVKLLDKFDFYNYDDYWLKTLLNRIYSLIQSEKRIKIKENPNFKLDYKLAHLDIYLEMVLFRNNNHIITQWKRNDDIDSYIKKIKQILNHDSLPEIDEITIIKNLNSLFKNELIESKECLNLINSDLEKKSISLIIKKSKKRIFNDKVSNCAKIESQGETKKAYEVSKYLGSLKILIESYVDFKIYIVGNNIKQNKDLSEYSLNVLINRTVEYIIKINKK